MTNWKDRKDPARLFTRRVGIAALVLLVVFAAAAVWNVYEKERESRALRLQVEGQLEDLRAREAKLNVDIAKLETDRGLEEALRDQYEVAKAGERLLIIVEPATAAPARATSSVLQWFRDTFFSW
jgi:cell division protein FtsB